MRIIGSSTKLGHQGLRKEALEGFWKKWNKPSSPSSPGNPSSPQQPVQDAYSQYAMQYGADFQQKLEAISPWTDKALPLLDNLSQYLATGLKLEFPLGNPIVNSDSMKIVSDLTDGIKVWKSFAARELHRLEQLKPPPTPYPWDEEAVAVMNRSKEVSKRSWAQISGELSQLKKVYVSAEEVSAKYQQLKSDSTSEGLVETSGSNNQKGSLLSKASIPRAVGMNLFSCDTTPKSETFEDQLKAGISIEKEHAGTINKIIKDVQDGKLDMDSEKIAELIARDHLQEFPNYYSLLTKMEKEAEL